LFRSPETERARQSRRETGQTKAVLFLWRPGRTSAAGAAFAEK
jgi:hypothetical protein